MYKIIRKSKIWFSFSLILILLSIISISVFGLRIGIDYKGGTNLEFVSENSNRVDLARDTLNELNYSGYQIKESGDDEVIIQLRTLSNDEHEKLISALQTKLTNFNEINYDTVGPVIGRDLTVRSIWAIVLAALGIILFIAFAFRKVPRPLSSWKFGVCAVAALIHDLIITVGFVSIVGHFYIWMTVDALFITALLTILGFSVHDTIVVYDRLRENFIKNPKRDIAISAEESVNQTVVRSINTSATTIIVLLAMLIFGSSSIQHFILTLILGISVGTYSSIYIAAPLLVRWHQKTK